MVHGDAKHKHLRFKCVHAATVVTLLCNVSAMCLQCVCNVSAMCLQWVCNGSAMGLQWVCYGSAMGLQWVCNGSELFDTRCRLMQKRSQYQPALLASMRQQVSKVLHQKNVMKQLGCVTDVVVLL